MAFAVNEAAELLAPVRISAIIARSMSDCVSRHGRGVAFLLQEFEVYLAGTSSAWNFTQALRRPKSLASHSSKQVQPFLVHVRRARIFVDGI